MNWLVDQEQEQEPGAMHMASKKRLAVIVGVANEGRRLIHFNYFLYASWSFLTTLPTSNQMVLDLLVSCEMPACFHLPPNCLPMESSLKYSKKHEKHPSEFLGDAKTLFPDDDVSNCWWFPQPEISQEWQDLHYGFIYSLAFIISYPFPQILPRYDLILRTDEDAFLSPSLLTFTPTLKAYFGNTGYTNDFTQERLRFVAAKYNYSHRHVSNICSGWLVPPSLIHQIVDISLKVGVQLAQNEFGKNVPGVSQFFTTSDYGSWPSWWRGVISLYAAEIAINHVLPDLSQANTVQTIDCPSSREDIPLRMVLHIHCMHEPDEFSKFQFYDEHITSFLGMDEKQQENYLYSFMQGRGDSNALFAISSLSEVINMSPRRYSQYIVWRTMGAHHFPDINAKQP